VFWAWLLSGIDRAASYDGLPFGCVAEEMFCSRSRAWPNCRPRRAAIFRHSIIALWASGVRFVVSIRKMDHLVKGIVHILVWRFQP
jgi:hypothetical protein